MLSLREKSRALEGKLRELVQFGEENDLISDRVHRLTLALLAARDLPGVLQSLYQQPARRLRRARRGAAPVVDAARRQPPELEPLSQEARVFAESLTNPYFSDAAMFESAAWFGADGSEPALFRLRLPARGAAVRRAGARQPRRRALHPRHGHPVPRASGRAGERGAAAPPGGLSLPAGSAPAAQPPSPSSMAFSPISRMSGG